MEQEIFSWDSFDEVDDQVLQFYNCTFKKNFGPFVPNQNVTSITIEFSTGKIEVYLDSEDTDPIFSGTLKLELVS